MKRRKILYVAKDISEINGLHLDYIEGLRSLGCRVYTMTADGGADFTVELDRGAAVLGAVREIKRLMTKTGFDSVVVSGYIPALAVRLAVGLRGRPRIIYIPNGYRVSGRGALGGRIMSLMWERLLRRRTDAVIATTETDAQVAVEHRLCREKVYKTSGFGVKRGERISDLENLRDEYADSDSFIICVVGELSRENGIDAIVRAFPMLMKEIPSVVLWIIGEGQERRALGELARMLEIKDRVVFLPFREDACDFLGAADLCVSGCGEERLPYSAFIAMKEGVPALLPNTETNGYVLVSGKTGLLYEYKNMVDFVNKCCHIYDEECDFNEADMKSTFEKFSSENVFCSTLLALADALGVDVNREKIEGLLVRLSEERKKF